MSASKKGKLLEKIIATTLFTLTPILSIPTLSNAKTQTYEYMESETKKVTSIKHIPAPAIHSTSQILTTYKKSYIEPIPQESSPSTLEPEYLSELNQIKKTDITNTTTLKPIKGLEIKQKTTIPNTTQTPELDETYLSYNTRIPANLQLFRNNTTNNTPTSSSFNTQLKITYDKDSNPYLYETKTQLHTNSLTFGLETSNEIFQKISITKHLPTTSIFGTNIQPTLYTAYLLELDDIDTRLGIKINKRTNFGNFHVKSEYTLRDLEHHQAQAQIGYNYGRFSFNFTHRDLTWDTWENGQKTKLSWEISDNLLFKIKRENYTNSSKTKTMFILEYSF